MSGENRMTLDEFWDKEIKDKVSQSRWRRVTY
jgi:hypothetical protein